MKYLFLKCNPHIDLLFDFLISHLLASVDVNKDENRKYMGT